MMRNILLSFLLLWLTACGESEKVFTPLSQDAVILAFGDSLTYGKGAKRSESYPAVLQRLTGRQVINEGISGEVSQVGLKRLPALLDQHNPKLLILIHGGNDILRKIPAAKTVSNLKQMIAAAKQRNIDVVMLGVPDLGLFALESADIYQQVAEAENVPVDLETLPDILGSLSLKADAVHPNAAGYKVMAEAIHEFLRDTGAL